LPIPQESGKEKNFRRLKNMFQTSLSRYSGSWGRKCCTPYWGHGGALMREAQSSQAVAPKVGGYGAVFPSPNGEVEEVLRWIEIWFDLTKMPGCIMTFMGPFFHKMVLKFILYN